MADFKSHISWFRHHVQDEL